MLIVSNNGVGCIDTAYYTFLVYEEVILAIPNVFTPNGDGTNDQLTVTASGITEFSCEIFDRWGLKMYELKSASEGWDGRTTSGSVAAEWNEASCC